MFFRTEVSGFEFHESFLCISHSSVFMCQFFRLLKSTYSILNFSSSFSIQYNRYRIYSMLNCRFLFHFHTLNHILWQSRIPNELKKLFWFFLFLWWQTKTEELNGKAFIWSNRIHKIVWILDIFLIRSQHHSHIYSYILLFLGNIFSEIK